MIAEYMNSYLKKARTKIVRVEKIGVIKELQTIVEFQRFCLEYNKH
jgi:hypothetical protein